MPRPTRLLEGRSLLLPLVVGVVLASLSLLVSYDASEAAPGSRPALAQRLAVALTEPLAGRSLFDPARFSVWADSDSVAVGDSLARLLDSLGVAVTGDSLSTDSLAALMDTTDVLPDTGRAARLLPAFRRDPYGAAVLPRRRTPLGLNLGTYWERRVDLDSTEAAYTITERVGGGDVRVPVRLGLDAYREQRLALGLDENYRELVTQRSRRQQRRGDLSILNIEIPGGRSSAFAGIFGSNEVDLRVNGQANIDLGFAYRENEQQTAATGQGGRVDPDFGQELGLGITGSIGDKLQINVNYDTQNDFDFQNQVKLTYTGYEDDIIQRIEAGNVFLQTPSDLIRGGQRLFGIRTDLQLGGLGVTVVASQQDAESDELSIEGGTQTTAFSKQPAEYEDNTNFYLGYYFHNRWDAAHATPPNIVLGPDFQRIEEIEVYLYEQSNANTTGSEEAFVRALGLVDLGEPESVLQGGEAYLATEGETPPLPSPIVDKYTDQDLEDLRLIPRDRDFDIGDRFGLENADFYESTFRKLRLDQDFTVDRILGTVSLRRSLNNNEAIAVAYTYVTAAGTTVQVGDLNQGTGSSPSDPPIILKLLRSQNPDPGNASWDLTMRNIYRVGGSGLTPTDFELQVLYSPGAQAPQRTLPGVDIGQQQTLLQTLGFDRVNQDRVRTPDDLFDFLPLYTIDQANGRAIFPYRQPFGAHLRRVLEGAFEEPGQSPEVRFQGGLTAEEAIQEYVFEELYDLKAVNAQQNAKNNIYDITGSFRGSVQEVYDLGFAVVDNSVQVRSGNIELTEGTDYIVDYATGTVTITNQTYLVSGRDVKISFERNQFVAIQKKTLLGLRASYDFSDRFGVGATVMRLSEKPLIDKYRLGEEPIANSIWGFDARYEAEPRWMTRLVDALPLVQTRAPSFFEFKGEFAQFNPGHPESFAFEESQRDLQDEGRDFQDDELDGISYIDDFEGTENSFSLLQPGAWQLAGAPTGTEASPGAGPTGTDTYLPNEPITSPLLRTNWRGLFAWYTVLNATFDNDDIQGLSNNNATRRVRVQEVFPERQLESNQPNTLTTLDLYIDPTRRGPYNYNSELATTFASAPQDAWGAMAQRLPEGYTDFDARNNIEFVEFIFSPYGGKNGDDPIDPNARLYVELGQTTEDIIPNRQYNREDGLLGGSIEGEWGLVAQGQPDGIINIDSETQQTEDLGLDGLPSQLAASAALVPYERTESDQFADFLSSLGDADAATRALAALDPSADDFRSFQDTDYFGNSSLFPGGATLQERFSQFFPGLELNSLEAQNQIAGNGTPGNSRQPDTEDINFNLSPDITERFFRYEIPLNRDIVDVPCSEGQTLNCNPYYITTIQNNEIEGAGEWFLIRIPVRTDRKVAIGGIQDFSLIESVRIWTDGHTVPATMRFATLDLVGSQWLKSEEVGFDDDGPTSIGVATDPQLFVATINNEENPAQYRIPNGTVRSFTRDPASGRPRQNREQALVFRVDDLGDGQRRALFKPYTRRLDLTKYSNLRMFVHGENFERRDSVRVFVRLGSDETEDYYEIEQPLYPFELPPGVTDIEDFISSDVSASDSLWQTNVPVETPEGTVFIDLNSINIEFDALNKLKIERDFALTDGPAGEPFPIDSVYTARSIPLDFAPPGTVIRIKGTPSVKDIASIVMGVRNADDRQGRTLSPELWFNELRVSGFDEESGRSAYARSTVRLADFLDVSARYEQQTDGFGGLSSGLGDRTFDDTWGYSVTTNLNAHKLLPERYGWRLPINVAVQRSVSTPRFSPSRGDITVAQEIAQVQESDVLTDAEKDAEISSIRASAETASFSRVIRVPVSKSGSRSPWLRYTLDGLSLTYTNTLRTQRSPSRTLNNTDQWGGTLAYRLTVPRPKTVRPLWFLDRVPILGVVGGLRLNVLPQGFRFSADASRTINENQDRPRRGQRFGEVREAAEAARPDFIYPIREQHTFGHRRNVEVQYNPFQFLSMGYRSDVRQSLNSAGAEETFATLVQDYRGGDVNNFQEFDLSSDEVIAQEFGGELPDSVVLYPVSRLDIIPAPTVLGDVFTGERSILTDDYNQNITATLQSPVERIEALNWFRLQPVTFSSNFTWRYTPLPGQDPRERAESDTTVAALANQASLRTGLNLRLGELFGKFGFYEGIREAQDEAQQARAQRRQRFDQELQAYRTARDRVAEIEAELAAVEAADTTGGVDPLLDELRAEIEDARLGADTLQRPSPPLPIPNPLDLARRSFLALTGPRDVSITYNGSFGGSSQGVLNPGYSLLDGLTGDGPSLGYRLGLQREIGATAEDRFFGNEQNGTIQVQDAFRDDHQFTARTALEFSQALRVDLNWNLGFDLQKDVTYSRDNIDNPQTRERGSGNATVIAFGGSYEDLFNLQLARYYRDAGNDGDPQDNVLESDVLSNNSVVEDFRQAFTTSLGDIGRGGFNAIPLPNWSVTYSGVSNWPLVRTLAQSATLRHGYSATYDAGFESRSNAGEDNFETLPYPAESGLTSLRLRSDVPFLEAQTVRVSARFQPLLGVNLSFKGGFQADVNWNSSDNHTLTTTNANVNQTKTDELSLRLSFSKTGLRLPIFGRRRLNNTLRFSLIVSQADNLTRRFLLPSDLGQEISGVRTLTFLDPEGERTTRLSLEPQLSYTLSNQVTAAVFLRYQKFDSEGSRNPSTTTINGGFNFRVSFSN